MNIVKAPLRWVMYSPRRLFGTAVAVLVLVLVAQCLTSAPDTAAPTPAATATSPTGAPPTPPPLMGDSEQVTYPQSLDTGPVQGTEQAVELAAAQVAVAYLEAWGRPELPRHEWLAGVAPYVTGRCYETLKTVNPANTQPLQIDGPAIMRTYLEGDSAMLWVPTDIGQIKVSLVNAKNGVWLVDTVSLDRSPMAPS
ncbi:MAG: hypothetical protein FWD18_01620 [Micrococcales bacterium]|nr:hypothetical protein [Micrococcales bacterium]